MQALERLQAKHKKEIENVFSEIKSCHRRELQRQHDDYQSKKDELQRQIASLTTRCETFDAVLAENVKLRSVSIQRGGERSPTAGIECKQSCQDGNVGVDQQIFTSVKGGNHTPSKEDGFISIVHFKALQDRCEEYARQLQVANSSGERYRAKCLIYRTRHRQDKYAVKSWQDYHDKLVAMSQNSQPDIPGLITEISTGMPTVAGASPRNIANPSQSMEGNRYSEPHDSGNGISPPAIGLHNPFLKDVIRQGNFEVSTESVEQGQKPVVPQVNELDERINAMFLLQNPLPADLGDLKPPDTKLDDSQETEGDLAIEEPLEDSISSQPAPTPDEVQFVSSRLLKRKRSEVAGPFESKPNDVKHIKREKSSSPIVVKKHVPFTQQATMDLDEIPSNYKTPRKKVSKRLRQSAPFGTRTANQDQHLRTERSWSLPVEGTCNDSNLESPVGLHQHQTSNPIQMYDDSHLTFGDLQGLDAGPQDLNNSRSKDNICRDQVLMPQRQPLQSIDINKSSITPKVRDTLSSKFHRDVKPAIHAQRDLLLTDDGFHEMSRSLTASTVDLKAGLKQLNELKFERGGKQTPQGSTKKVHQPYQTPVDSRKRTSNFAWATGPSRRRPDSPAIVRPASEAPLRSKRMDDLRPNDFRVNTDANNGRDYAYAETVRQREARRCLPGCTRPECCGERFRKMAQIGGVVTPTRGLWDADADKDDPDDRLLREYMGHNVGVLASMTREQKAEALLKAKVAQLAGSVGKHRAQWQRSRTPPGFWRTDFPTTQEIEGDQVESKRREREEVEDRYREAMRKSGRWKFADE